VETKYCLLLTILHISILMSFHASDVEAEEMFWDCLQTTSLQLLNHLTRMKI